MCTPLCGTKEQLEQPVATVACNPAPAPQPQPRIHVTRQLDLGAVAIGAESARGTLVIQNRGDADLVITHFELAPPVHDFHGVPRTSRTLAPGEGRTYRVWFTPTHAGPQDLGITIHSNDPARPQRSTRLTGIGQVPRMTVPPSLDFGDLAIGATKTLDLPIQNDGQAELEIRAIAFPATQFAADPTNSVVASTRVPPGTVVQLKVRFTPTGPGAYAEILHIVSNDPAATGTKDVALTGRQLEPTLEMYRGGQVLEVVPFATIDHATVLDSDVYAGAAAAFPRRDTHATDATADADPSVFRFRLRNAPVGLAPPITVNLKVKTAAGHAILGVIEPGASHAAGMDVELAPPEWSTPYLRVATTSTLLSNSPDHAIVHSLPYQGTAFTAADRIEHGRQLGRRLFVECTVAGMTLTTSYVMGGTPYARIPLRFTLVSDHPPTVLQTKTALAKLANLNQYYAGQGLEFVFLDPNVPIASSPAPQQRLLAINDFTGAAVVSAHDIDVAIDVKVTIAGPQVHTETITTRIPASSTPPVAAGLIRDAIAATVLPGAFAGVQLGADVHDFPAARLYLQIDLSAGPCPLPAVGARGPADVVLTATGNPDRAEFTRVAATNVGTGLADTTVDFLVPPVALPFHDTNFNPPAAPTRLWVRTFGGGDFVSLVIEPVAVVRQGDERKYAALTQRDLHTKFVNSATTTFPTFAWPFDQDLAGSNSPYAILTFGRWAEVGARFISFLPQGSFNETRNDIQHEVGHAIADANHVKSAPDWFYQDELMHASGPAAEKALKITRHPIEVDVLEDVGGWRAAYVTCPNGYGGRMRARIQQLAGTWLVTTGLAPGQPPW